MASATRTRDHEQIRAWVEERGGIPTVVKGTGGLLRIDFIEGAESHGREASLEEVSWERWFELFDESQLSFLFSPEGESRFFKLVRAEPERDSGRAARGSQRPAPAAQHRHGKKQRTVVLVSQEERGWQVALDDGEDAQHYPTKAEAVRHGRELAHAHEPCELVIERVDGEEEHIEYGMDASSPR
jgi:hypothetical protein